MLKKSSCAGAMMLMVALIGPSAPAGAAVETQEVEYRDGETVLDGFFAVDTATEETRPGILVVHEYKGLGEYARKRAVQLAEMGYAAFAVDMYGRGVRPATHEEAAATAGIYKSDRTLMRRRILAGYEVLKGHPSVDPSRIGAIGYCFGGTTVLELARSGAPVAGVVSFHGGLATPDPLDARRIKGRVLVLHGAQDPHVKTEEVEAFKREMNDANAKWRLVAYEGAVHSFTVPAAGDDPSTGVAYNADADQRSWAEMTAFFADIFGAGAA